MVDKAVSLKDVVQYIYFTVTAPAKENYMNICKPEGQLSVLKSYDMRFQS